MRLELFQVTLSSNCDQTDEHSVSFFCENHLQKGFKYFEVQIESHWAEFDGLEVNEENGTEFVVGIVTELTDLVHFRGPFFMNLSETLKELIVVRVVSRGKFSDSIAETDVKLFVDGSDCFESSGFIELLQETVVLSLQIVVKLWIGLSYFGQIRAKLIFIAF